VTPGGRAPAYFLGRLRTRGYDRFMRCHAVVVAVVMAAVVAGCASAPPRPMKSEFEDIPVPKGLNFQPDKSIVIESPSVKAARLVYRGRVQPDSLATAMRTTLEANGWRAVSSTTGGGQIATQVYEKGGNSLQVQIWEGLIFTYVELTASRALK
jgi:hypothetical protein